MTFEEIVSLIVNNGMGIACMVYFIFRDYKFMNTLMETLITIKILVEKGSEECDKIRNID